MAKTTTTPAFYFASRGQGVVSQCVIQYGSFAPIETILFKTILKDRCVMQNGSRELVIDIGGNLGYFSIYAALHGCRVKTYEPVPGPYWYIELNVGLNNVIGLVETHRNAIGSERGFLKMNEHPDWGLSMINMNGNLEVEVITIDDIIKENIILMKVDIEGYESYALKALEDVMKKFTIENIILEMKRVNEDWGRALVNRLVEKEGYLVMSYQEEYGTPNHNKNLDQINCINMHGLNAGQWIPYEDLWIVKKDSVTYNRVSSILKCHN
jgi:FkbM family methyltransferase